MSTRSFIAIKTVDGVEAVYCHSDGYLEGVGRTLALHYATEPEAVMLLAMGDVSVLGPTIEESKFYMEDNSPACRYDSVEDMIEDAWECDAFYVYLFDGGWKCIVAQNERVEINLGGAK